MKVNEVRKFVNILRVIYISFYSLAFRTRIDAVELIVKKDLMLWWSFSILEVTFYSLLQFQDKNKFKCTIEAAIRKSLEIANSDINRPMRQQFIICHKNELLSLLSSIKLVLIRNKCYQCKLICTAVPVR